jgi:predicted PurR-regulated permease PerM
VKGWPANWLSSRRVAAVVVLGLALWLIRSFIVPLIWAAIFATSNWPLYRRCAHYLPSGMKNHVLPLLFSALILLLVLGPVVFAFGILAEQSQVWVNQIAVMDQHGLMAPSWLSAIPMVGPRFAEYWDHAAGAPGRLSSWLSRADSASLLHSAQSIGRFIAYHAFVSAVTVVALFFLFRQGESLASLAARRIDERFGQAGIRYLGVGVAALRATLQSMVLVGVADGILLGIAYAALQIPSPAGWGAVTGILAMLPFMGYLAVAAVCAGLLAHHATVAAMFIGLVGIAVLFISDKFVRPMLMAQGARLNFLGALMGTVGGLQTFGLLGIFIGPVIIALGRAIFEEWLYAGSTSGDRVATFQA